MGSLLMRRREMVKKSGELVENFVRVGNPTIENGIMTASPTSWIETPQPFNPGNDPWELTFKIFRPSIPATREAVCASPGVSLYTPYQSASVKVAFYSSTGTIVEGVDGFSVPAGGWRWLRMVFAGSSTGYDYGWSADGVTYTYLGNVNTPFTGYRNSKYKTATPIAAGVFGLGSCTRARWDSSAYKSYSQFDLTETVIKINGSVWWKPYIRG